MGYYCQSLFKIFTVFLLCCLQDAWTRELDVVPVNYTISISTTNVMKTVEYSDEACQLQTIPSQGRQLVCTPDDEGRVPKLMDCDLGPLTEPPTTEHFYFLHRRKDDAVRTLHFAFTEAVNFTILHHFCTTTAINRLPSVQIIDATIGMPIPVSVGDGRVSTEPRKITCERGGQRGNTTLILHPLGGRTAFRRLQLNVMFGVGAVQQFNPSEVQFFATVPPSLIITASRPQVDGTQSSNPSGNAASQLVLSCSVSHFVMSFSCLVLEWRWEWYHNGMQIDENQRIIEETNGTQTSSLILHDPDCQDVGNYTCRVESINVQVWTDSHDFVVELEATNKNCSNGLAETSTKTSYSITSSNTMSSRPSSPPNHPTTSSEDESTITVAVAAAAGAVLTLIVGGVISIFCIVLHRRKKKGHQNEEVELNQEAVYSTVQKKEHDVPPEIPPQQFNFSEIDEDPASGSHTYAVLERRGYKENTVTHDIPGLYSCIQDLQPPPEPENKDDDHDVTTNTTEDDKAKAAQEMSVTEDGEPEPQSIPVYAAVQKKQKKNNRKKSKEEREPEAATEDPTTIPVYAVVQKKKKKKDTYTDETTGISQSSLLPSKEDEGPASEDTGETTSEQPGDAVYAVVKKAKKKQRKSEESPPPLPPPMVVEDDMEQIQLALK